MLLALPDTQQGRGWNVARARKRESQRERMGYFEISIW